MSGFKNLLIPLIHLGFAMGVDKLAQMGKDITSLPMVAKTESPVIPKLKPDTYTLETLGTDDGNWSRRDQRRFRKSLGWSKLEMRNWKALQLGLNSDRNYSRKDLKVLENYKLGNNPASDFYARLILNEDALGNPLVQYYKPEYIENGTYNGRPIIEEVVEDEPLPEQSPSYFKTPGEMYLLYVQERFGLLSLPYMQLPQQLITPPIPLTYNFGNNMNGF